MLLFYQMRVIIDGVVYSSAPTGGIYRYFNELIRRLSELPDTDVEVYTPRTTTLPPQGPHIKIHQDRLPSGSFMPNGWVKDQLSKLKKLIQKKLLNREMGGFQSGDAVYHSTYYTPSPWPELPQVVTVYDMISEKFPEDAKLPHNIVLSAAKRKSVQAAKRVIAISQATKDDLCEIYGISPSVVDVIYFGLDRSFYAKAATLGEKQALQSRFKLTEPYVLYVGGRLHHKNFKRLARAYAASKIKSNYLLAVAGFAWDEEEKALLKSLGIEDRVRWMPYLDSELPAIYQMASLFVFPSLYEGFGLPLIEAFAAGTPVAAANAGPFPELAAGAAYLFDPEDIDAITKALETMVDPKLAQEYRKRGLKRAEDFDWSIAAAKTRECYLRAMGESLDPKR